MDPQAPTTKNIVIIGGSISGLMTAHTLSRLCPAPKITILEARTPDKLRSQAAGLGLSDYAIKLMRTAISRTDDATSTGERDAEGEEGKEEASFGVRREIMQFLATDARDGNGDVVLHDRDLGIRHVSSSWSLVYRVLRDSVEGRGVVYRDSVRVSGLERKDGEKGVLIRCARTSSEASEEGGLKKNEEEMEADIVIIAAGASSPFRKMVGKPESEYAGFLLWRGSLPESKVPEELAGVKENRFVISVVEGSYCLGYLAPNKNGSLTPGERSFEWAQYDFCPSHSPAFTAAMTDKDGHLHKQTVPRGLLSPSIWASRVERAQAILPHPWPLVAALTQPEDALVSAVYSSSPEDKKARFWDDTVLFVGEAYAQIRPHLGLGSNLAAFQAVKLTGAMAGEGEGGFEQWERECGEWVDVWGARSEAMGVRALTGKWPVGREPVVDFLEGI